MSEKEVGIDIVPFDLKFEDPYLERTFILIADGAPESARDRISKILDEKPRCAEAYLALLLLELGLSEVSELSIVKEPFDDRKSYKRAVEFASAELREYLKDCALSAMQRYEAAHAYIAEEDIDGEKDTAEETAPTEDAPKADKPARAPRKPLSKKAKGIIIAAASVVLIVGIVLAIALLVPRLIMIDDGDYYTVSGYSGIMTNVVIPEEYNGKPVKRIGNNAFYGCRSLSSVAIPDSVIRIGTSAFFGCESLETITVSADNTEYKDIDGNLYTKDGATLVQYAIGKKDTSFTVPDGVESIGAQAFVYCTSLESVVIPDSTTSIGSHAFYKCTSLSSVAIGDSLESIGVYAFRDCTSLESIIIPSSVTTIEEEAFSYCTSLTIYCEAEKEPSGWYRDWNFSNRPVEWGHTADVCFDGNEDGLCDKCKRETVNQPPNPATDFTYEISGDEVTITKYKVTDTTVVIPSTIEDKPVTSIGDSAFWYCTILSSVAIPDSVTSIGEYAFYGCKSLTSIVIPDSVTSIGDYAFSNCPSLTSIVIPDSVTSIRDYAFAGCTSLEDITVSADNTAYKDINGNLYTKDGKTLIQYAIGKKDTSFIIPNSVTSIGDFAFSGCASLSSVVIGDSVTSIGVYVFSGCTSLSSIVIPDSVTSIGEGAFSGCDSLRSIVIPDSVTSIGNSVFENCTSLESVAIGDSVTSIGEDAFRDCTSLTSAVIPDSVTSIGNNAFYNCRSLSNIVIPESVISIGWYAFSGCTSLTIYCEAEEQPSGWDDDWNSSNRPVEWGYTAEG